MVIPLLLLLMFLIQLNASVCPFAGAAQEYILEIQVVQLIVYDDLF
jgi:hypothetical protein